MKDGKKADVLIIGLGQIGYSNAEYMTSKGLNVDGYDVDEKALSRAFEDGVIRRKTRTFKDYDHYVVCISTHNPNDVYVPYLGGIFEIAKRLLDEGKKGALLSIESTITQGTCNQIFDFLGHKLHVVHVPHRFYVNESHVHGVRQTRVLGGCRECCLNRSLRFYRDCLDIPLHLVSSIELAELSKIVENSYRFLEIAFAEELKMVCDTYDLDFNELRMAVNSKWNVKILEARDGIKGHCLPKDSQMYIDICKKALRTSILDSAKKMDSLYKLRKGRGLKQDLIVVKNYWKTDR